MSEIVFKEIGGLLCETGNIAPVASFSKKMGWGKVNHQASE